MEEKIINEMRDVFIKEFEEIISLVKKYNSYDLLFQLMIKTVEEIKERGDEGTLYVRIEYFYKIISQVGIKISFNGERVSEKIALDFIEKFDSIVLKNSLLSSVNSYYFIRGDNEPDVEKELLIDLLSSNGLGDSILIEVLGFTITDIFDFFMKYFSPTLPNNSFIIQPANELERNICDFLSIKENLKSNADIRLDDGVWFKPLINTGGYYICFFRRWNFINLRNQIEDALKQNGKYREKYNKIRTIYCEKKSIQVIGNFLDEAQSFHSIKYKQEDVQYEIDGILIYDKNIFILESKTSGVTKLARRGYTERMERDFKKGVLEAGIQLKRHLLAIKDGVVKCGGQQLRLNDYENVYCMSLTIEPFRGRQIKPSNESGPMTHFVSMSVFDLEYIIGKCESKGQFLEYLSERLKYKNLSKIQNEDELDYFGLFCSYRLSTLESRLEDADFYLFDGIGPNFEANSELKLELVIKDWIFIIESSKVEGKTIVTKNLISVNDNELIQSVKEMRGSNNSHIFGVYKESSRGLLIWQGDVINNKEHLQMLAYGKYKLDFLKIRSVGVLFINKDLKLLDWRYINKDTEVNTEVYQEIKKRIKLRNQINKPKKTGRNDVCWCGSLRKYKNCHRPN